MKTIFLSVFLASAVCLPAQNEFRASDFSRQINLPDNQGTVHINQYLVKSDEYKALEQQIADLDLAIKERQADCDAFAAAKLDERLAKCRQGKAALEGKKDSMVSVIAQFKEDVIRLAKTFENEKDNSALFQQAKSLFEAGKFREANTLLNVSDLCALGEEGLEKTRTAARLLRIKAQTKALDYTDPLRVDSAALCYRRSLHYADEADVWYDLAVFFHDNHRYDSAFACFPRVIAHPKAAKWQMANAYSYWGDLYTVTGDLPNALAQYEKFISIVQPLASNEPDFKQLLSVGYERLGSTYTALGNLPQALIFFEKYNQLETAVHEAFPQNVDFKNGLAISYERLGSTHTALGNLPQALIFFEKYNQLETALHEAFPQNVEFKKGLAISYLFLGQFYRDHLKDPAGAIEYIGKGYELYEELVRDFPDFADFRGNYTWAQNALNELEQASDPVFQLQQRIQSEPDSLLQYQLYTDLCDTLRRRAALDPAQKAAFANALNSRAWSGFFLQKFAEAEADIREGLALGTDNKYLISNLAPALLLQGKKAEAIAEYKKRKDQSFLPSEFPTYRAAFLDDLDAFEAAGIIPPERKADVAAVRDLLKQ
jgi:tetratricopeptide (TPR) repeat protein